MNATLAARLKMIESTLSTEAGVPVECTIRGERSFTWSFDGRNDAAAERLANIARRQGDSATVEVVDINANGDCGEGPMLFTSVYVEAAAL